MTRQSLLAAMMTMIMMGWPASTQPTELVLLESTLIMYPGETQSTCLDVERGMLTVVAWSLPGRTGEDARLSFRPNGPTTNPEVSLSVNLSLDDITARHFVEAGSYCYWVSVTSRMTDMGDQNRPERPNKQTHVKVTHEARP